MSQSSIQTVKHWDVIKSIRDARNHGNRRKWGRGRLFLPLNSCRVAPRLEQFEEQRHAASDCYEPGLGRGTNLVSAASLLSTFVRDTESHFKMMKTG